MTAVIKTRLWSAWIRAWALVCGLWLASDGQALAGAPDPALYNVPEIAFCETGAGHDTTGCRWQSVKLPHRWTPSTGESGQGVYWLQWPQAPTGQTALLARRLSLHGQLQLPDGTRVRPNFPDGKLWRYWPVVFMMPVPEGTPEGPFEVLLQVEGHAAMKNGLGDLHWGDEAAVRVVQARQQFERVTSVLALAAASVLAGLLGLVPSHFRHSAGQMMFCIATLSLIAGLRMGLNFVTDPPLDWQPWSALNLSMLTAISVLEISVLALYLVRHSLRVLLAALCTWLVLSLSFFNLPAGWIYRVAETGFMVFTLTAVLLLTVLVLRLRKRPEALGWSLVLIYLLLIGLTIHDLALHLSRASISGGYLLIWLMPVLLMLMTGLMMRHLDQQHLLENALQRETVQREDLLRDLHDGIGSRLVALAFHARQIQSNSPLAEEIQSLMRELQLIQGAVRTAPKTLGAVLADARHLYAHLGGGQLPLHWDIDEDCAGLTLQAEQVIAVHRILDEAVANALKHAQPQTIQVQLSPAKPPWSARLTIDNDGHGHFEHRASGGLRNIALRAQRAGLDLRAYEVGSIKRVEVCLAHKQTPTWYGQLLLMWQRGQPGRDAQSSVSDLK
ncbi:hypothetical protein [Limnohabitans sp.]|uniref:sensor histidine kinase n=1 Tax=Limnohabitans sp. TaxID=1907725 RepID=UPI0025BBAFFE|nr:hypothetical protein [Limnohabitans sp.]